MAGTLKEIEFKRGFRNYRKGDRITPNGTLRDYLVFGGYADIVEAATPARPAKLSRKAVDKITDGAQRQLA